MNYFLTSSPGTAEGGSLGKKNNFEKRIREVSAGCRRGLFAASFPEDYAFTEAFAEGMRESLKQSGICFQEYRILDGRTAGEAADLVKNSDFMILAGGHVPTQNRFFQEISLRSLVRDYQGVILGISAGTMNSADVVYAQPELEGESTDPSYKRFLQGLGLTKAMILPHYQNTKNEILDGKRLFEDITYPDSAGRTFYALPDGSYLHVTENEERFFGEVWRIRDGRTEKICEEGENFVLSK